MHLNHHTIQLEDTYSGYSQHIVSPPTQLTDPEPSIQELNLRHAS
jgi:hypothetical protein